MVAVSKDFKLESEEKYKVWAAAVGRTPKPIRGRSVSRLPAASKVAPAKTAVVPTVRAAAKYVRSIVGNGDS